MNALISIHDVMPSTLDRVQRLTEQLAHLESSNISMLVVPGHAWSNAQIAVLHRFEKQGFVLSGHGWSHACKNIRGIYHRLHSLLISRDAAEHLALNEDEIRQLLNDCYGWFSNNDLGIPDLYVPPAWAMGNISPQHLEQSPFRFFENTAGLYDSITRQQINLPLAGFEADTLLRVGMLKFWNALNIFAGSEKIPVRISIHPADQELLMGKAMSSCLQSVTKAIHYRTLFSRNAEPGEP